MAISFLILGTTFGAWYDARTISAAQDLCSVSSFIYFPKVEALSAIEAVQQAVFSTRDGYDQSL